MSNGAASSTLLRAGWPAACGDVCQDPPLCRNGIQSCSFPCFLSESKTEVDARALDVYFLEYIVIYIAAGRKIVGSRVMSWARQILVLFSGKVIKVTMGRGEAAVMGTPL